MNSLEELNSYGTGKDIEHADNRDPDVIFDRVTPTNQSVTVTVNQTHTVPVGIEIVEIINYDVTDATYTINFGGTTASTVTWPTLQSGDTATNPVTGQYILSYLKSKTAWDYYKSPTVTPPSGFTGYYTYTATINYIDSVGAKSKSWTVANYVGAVTDLSTPLIDYFDKSTTQTIQGNPVLTATVSPIVYTLTVTPSNTANVTTLSSSGTGGTSTFNGSTKVLTLTGTVTQVNSHLNSISFVATAIDSDFNLTYNVSNNFNASTDTKVQLMRSSAVEFLSATDVFYYNEDTDRYITNAPLITDDNFVDSVGYTLTVTPSSTSAVTLLNSFGNAGGTESFNNTTKVLTLTGTRAQINNHLRGGPGPTVIGFAITPGNDFASNFTLTYAVTTPRSSTASKVQNALIGVTDVEVTNLGITRSYTANQANQIFATNTPQIGDVTVGASFTVFLSSSLGKFAINSTATPTDTITLSGSRTGLNSQVSGIRFYPTPGSSASGYVNWVQTKNGVTQVNTSFVLNGTAAAFAGTRDITFTSSQTFTPTATDVYYGKIANLLVVGGGGGGGAGGGGGGQVIQSTNLSLSNQTYNIIVGAGGAASSNWGRGGSGGLSGGSSSAFGSTASGGSGGYIPMDPRNDESPSDGGSNSSYPNQGGEGVYGLESTLVSGGVTYRTWASGGGGGAGSGGGGYPATLPNASDLGAVRGGNGGAGTLATYFGGYYAWGGGGSGSSRTYPGHGGVGSKAGASDTDNNVNSYYNGGLSNGASDYGFDGPPLNAYTYTGSATASGTNTGAGGGGGSTNNIDTANRTSPFFSSISGGGIKSWRPPTAGSAGIVKIRITGQ